jgi:hypothetical protein
MCCTISRTLRFIEASLLDCLAPLCPEKAVLPPQSANQATSRRTSAGRVSMSSHRWTHQTLRKVAQGFQLARRPDELRVDKRLVAKQVHLKLDLSDADARELLLV